MKFDRALRFTLRWEGGYVDHPNDPGGETNFGISKRAHPELDIPNLTSEQAGVVYRAAYWDPLSCDVFPEPVAIALFDYGVNSGIRRAAKCLQRVVGAEVDGVIGPATISKTLSATGILDVAGEINTERAAFLAELSQRAKYKPFAVGWARRVASCASYCHTGGL